MHTREGTLSTVGLVALLASSLAAAPVAAQAPEERAESEQAETRDAVGEPRWWALWSVPSEERRVVLGMFTTHVNSSSREGWQNDWMIGLVARSIFAATFITSHGDRGVTAGFERAWLKSSRGPYTGMLGFRAGLMYGYDEKLGWLAGDVPVLPYGQLIAYGRAGPLGVDVGYTWVALSVTVAYRF